MCRTLFLWISFTVLLFADFKEGSLFSPTTFIDQFDRPVTISLQDRVIIVVFDKVGYYDVNTFVKRKGEGYLKEKKIRYLNDISTMPEGILNYFVKPQMQNKPFSILLVKDQKVSQELNYQDGKITIYHLNKGKITKIDFVESDMLDKALPL